MKHRLLLGGLLLSLSCLVRAADPTVFDVHVHIWEGEKSVKEYLAQAAADGQEVTRFGGIHMAVAGKVAETRAKNDELIALAKRYPMSAIASVHPYDGYAAFAELCWGNAERLLLKERSTSVR